MNEEKLSSPTVIKNFCSRDSMLSLLAEIISIYDRLDKSESDDALANDIDLRESHFTWGGLNARQLMNHGDSTSIEDRMRHLIEALKKIWPDALWLPEFTSFRRLETKTTIRYHTDWEGAGIGENAEPTWNCWLPLENVGGVFPHPSLEIIVGSDKPVVAHGYHHGTEKSVDWVNDHCSDLKRICPELKIGDALVFSDRLVHRTQPFDMQKMGSPRIGFELRFRPNIKSQDNHKSGFFRRFFS